MKATRAAKGGAHAGAVGYVEGVVAVVAPVRTAARGGGEGGLRRHDGLLVSSSSIFSRHYYNVSYFIFGQRLKM